MRAVLLALLLAGCAGVTEPSNVEVDAPDGADDAAEIVFQEYSERLPHAARLEVADLPPVRWFEGPCLDYGDDDPTCYLGMTWTGDAYEVHLIRRERIGDTLIAHELLHAALDRVMGDLDSDHVTAWWPDHLGEVEGIVRRAGL